MESKFFCFCPDEYGSFEFTIAAPMPSDAMPELYTMMLWSYELRRLALCDMGY
jgi:hypothetical protein